MVSAKEHNDPNGKATDRDEIRYLQLVDRMSAWIPAERRTATAENVRWFLRQGAPLAQGSWYVDEMITLAKKILNKEER